MVDRVAPKRIELLEPKNRFFRRLNEGDKSVPNISGDS